MLKTQDTKGRWLPGKPLLNLDAVKETQVPGGVETGLVLGAPLIFHSPIFHCPGLWARYTVKDRGLGNGVGMASEWALRGHADKHPLTGQNKAGSAVKILAVWGGFSQKGQPNMFYKLTCEVQSLGDG